MNAGERVGLDFVGIEYLRDALHADHRAIGCSHIVPCSLICSCEPRDYSSRIRSKLSHRDISDRTTWSPSFSPCRISTVLTELRPSLTWVRTAFEPSGSSLNIPTVLCSWPKAGRPT